MGVTACPIHDVKQPGDDRRVVVGTRRESAALPTLRSFVVSSHFTPLFSILPPISRPLREGRAERRWRLDACDAPDRPAMTGGQTPHRTNSPSKCPPCVHCAPQDARGCVRHAAHWTSKANVRRDVLRNPATGTLAFTALHVGFLARARARRYPSPAIAEAMADIGTTRLRPLAKASRGSLGSPSGIVRLSSHGSSLPGGAGLADLPGTVASRIGDATASPAIQGSPHEAPLVDEVSAICSAYCTQKQVTNS